MHWTVCSISRMDCNTQRDDFSLSGILPTWARVIIMFRGQKGVLGEELISMSNESLRCVRRANEIHVNPEWERAERRVNVAVLMPERQAEEPPLDGLRDPGVLQTSFQRAERQAEFCSFFPPVSWLTGGVLEWWGTVRWQFNTVNHLGKKELKSSVRDGAKRVRWGQRFQEHFRHGVDKPERESRAGGQYKVQGL